MQVCIVVMFILCQSVKIIPDIFEAVTCDHRQNTQEVRIIHFTYLLICSSHNAAGINIINALLFQSSLTR